MRLHGNYSLRTSLQPIYNKATIGDSSVTNHAQSSQQEQEICCLLSSSCRPLPSPNVRARCPAEPVAPQMDSSQRRIPKHAPSTTTVSKGQSLTSSVNLWLMDFQGSMTPPWTGAPTGTTLTVDLAHATTRQCAPPNRPRRQRQPLQTVELWQRWKQMKETKLYSAVFFCTVLFSTVRVRTILFSTVL